MGARGRRAVGARRGSRDVRDKLARVGGCRLLVLHGQGVGVARGELHGQRRLVDVDVDHQVGRIRALQVAIRRAEAAGGHVAPHHEARVRLHRQAHVEELRAAGRCVARAYVDREALHVGRRALAQRRRREHKRYEHVNLRRVGAPDGVAIGLALDARQREPRRALLHGRGVEDAPEQRVRDVRPLDVQRQVERPLEPRRAAGRRLREGGCAIRRGRGAIRRGRGGLGDGRLGGWREALGGLGEGDVDAARDDGDVSEAHGRDASAARRVGRERGVVNLRVDELGRRADARQVDEPRAVDGVGRARAGRV
mmetsp:Transcript_69613/g.208989  ORF Transcript_69613/g.208989 Transcript_69613/m.208989 type:complete len:310 (+) Transcript_69613:1525-2454(+)